MAVYTTKAVGGSKFQYGCNSFGLTNIKKTLDIEVFVNIIVKVFTFMVVADIIALIDNFLQKSGQKKPALFSCFCNFLGIRDIIISESYVFHSIA